MTKVVNKNARPRLRRHIKSLEEALELFRADSGGFLSGALQDVVNQNGTPPSQFDKLLGDAAHECGLALWKAIGKHNQFLLDQGVLGGVGAPDSEVTQKYELVTDIPAAADMSGRTHATPNTPPSKCVVRLRGSPTVNGKLRILVEEGTELSERIAEFVEGLEYISRTSILARSAAGIKVKRKTDRARLKSILLDETSRLRHDTTLRDITAILNKLSQYREAGGTPGYVFQRTFMASLEPFWHGLSGKQPVRGSSAYINFVAAAYYVFSEQEFEGWEGVLRTVIANRGKTIGPEL